MRKTLKWVVITVLATTALALIVTDGLLARKDARYHELIEAFECGYSNQKQCEADFDGDKRSDIALYRPTTGTWFSLNSSNGQFAAVQFGTAEDKPVPGDYDKDGRSDIAVWRPSIGDYFILNSSTGLARETHWGANGDIPIRAAR